jgi:hypothetical protein
LRDSAAIEDSSSFRNKPGRKPPQSRPVWQQLQ